MDKNITLEEHIKNSDPEIIWHIGAKSSFFFIGNKDEFEKDIDDISESFYENALTNKKFYERKMRDCDNKILKIDLTVPKKKKELGKLIEFIKTDAENIKHDIENDEFTTQLSDRAYKTLNNDLKAIGVLNS